MALTSVAMKCLEKLMLKKLNNHMRPLLDPYQFAYQAKLGIEDAILVFTNNIKSHLGRPNNYFRVLLVDFSSGFNILKTPFTDLQNVKSKNKRKHNFMGA